MVLNALSREKILSYLLIAVLAATVFIFIYSGLVNEPIVAVVKGKSMLPLLREGDIVFITRVKPSEINIGDVVVYKTPMGTLIIHRVIGIVVENNKYYYVTKGDNNPAPDFLYFVNGKGIPYERIVGKVIELNGVIFKIPYLGNLALMIRNES
ncbi:MAG: signal peptidase I [Desulfurococcaceae archaeon]